MLIESASPSTARQAETVEDPDMSSTGIASSTSGSTEINLLCYTSVALSVYLRGKGGNLNTSNQLHDYY